MAQLWNNPGLSGNLARAGGIWDYDFQQLEEHSSNLRRNSHEEVNMSKKLYKLCLIRGYTEAYYQLSEDEKKNLWEQVGKAIEKAGAKLSTPYYNCRWSNDKYTSFFLMEYPDVESAMMDTAGVEEAGLFRYMVSETILGVKEGEEATS